MIAARASSVRQSRGRAPAFVLVAFGDERGHVAHVGRKQRMCAEAGVDLTALVLPPGIDTAAALMRMHQLLETDSFDGVFVQFPFPDTIDGETFAAAVPVELDVDVMTPDRIARYSSDRDALPPVTVSAALLLLDEYDVPVDGRSGIVIADEQPFSRMLSTALARRGADVALVDPGDPGLEERIRSAGLVVVCAARPGLVRSGAIQAGAVAIDVGYFNEGGRGDIDVSGGIDHLAAICPVPGGIGPMTISALLERVVLFAEHGSG